MKDKALKLKETLILGKMMKLSEIKEKGVYLIKNDIQESFLDNSNINMLHRRRMIEFGFLKNSVIQIHLHSKFLQGVVVSFLENGKKIALSMEESAILDVEFIRFLNSKED